MNVKVLIQLCIASTLGLLAWHPGLPTALVVISNMLALVLMEHIDQVSARAKALERRQETLEKVIGDQVGALQKQLKDMSDKVVSNANRKAFGGG